MREIFYAICRIDIIIFVILYVLLCLLKRREKLLEFVYSKNIKKEAIIIFLIFYIPAIIMTISQTKRITTVIASLGTFLIISLLLTLLIGIVMIKSNPEKEKKRKELKRNSEILNKVNISKNFKVAFGIILMFSIISLLVIIRPSALQILDSFWMLLEAIIGWTIIYWLFIFFFVPFAVNGIIRRTLVKQLKCEEIEKFIYNIPSGKGKNIILIPINNRFVNYRLLGRRYKTFYFESIDLKLILKDIDYEKIEILKINNYINSLIEKYPLKPSIRIEKNQNDVEINCNYILQEHSRFSTFNVIDEFFIIYEMLEKIANEIN